MYKIYRKTGSGSYKLIGTTTSCSFKDTDVKAGKTYAYKVKAVNGSDKSAASQQIKIKKEKAADIIQNPVILGFE